MPLYRSTVTGAERISPDPLGYPWLELDDETPPEPVTVQYEYSVQTADAILFEVGNDPDLAAVALSEEQARETPRTSLVAKLERIVRNG